MIIGLMTFLAFAFSGEHTLTHHLFADSGGVRSREWALLIKDINHNGLADLVGEVVRYTVQITNHEDREVRSIRYEADPNGFGVLAPNSVRATNGTVRRELDVPVVEFESIPAKQHETIWFDITLEGRQIGFDRVICQGSVSANGLLPKVTDDPDTAAANDATVTFLGAEPAIAASKQDQLVVDLNLDGIAGPGDTLRYNVVIENRGTANGEAMAYSLGLNENLVLVNGTVTSTSGLITQGNSPGDPNLRVEIGTLETEKSVVISYDATVLDPLPAGVFTARCQGVVEGNFQTVLTDDPDTLVFADPTVTVLALQEQLTASKTDSLWLDVDGNGVINAGDTVRLTLTISNQGNFVASDTNFIMTQAQYLVHVPGSVTTTQGVVISGNELNATSVEVGLGDVAIGGTVVVTYDATVVDPLPAGVTEGWCQGKVTSSNTETLTDDPDLPGSQDATRIPFEQAPRMMVTKEDLLFNDLDSDGVADPGETLQYQVLVRNQGNGVAENAVFDSGFDVNTRLIGGSVTTSLGSITSGSGGGDDRVSVNLGNLNPGEEASITCLVVINGPPLPNVTQISCQGVLTGDNFTAQVSDDPSTLILDDPTITPLQQVALLMATKRDSLSLDQNGNGQANYGDYLTYTVEITNLGTDTATDAVFETNVDPNTRLLTGTVTSQQGTVILGNQNGDQSVQVDLGDIAVGESIQITFQVEITNPISGVTKAACQGRVRSGGNLFLTDDPDTILPGDATETELYPDVDTYAYASKRSDLYQDLDQDGRLDIGDSLMYQIEIQGEGLLRQVSLADSIDPNTRLVADSVTVSQGTVEIDGGTLRVDLGDVQGTARIQFLAEVAQYPQAARTIANQGLVRGLGFEIKTDDPDTPAWMDPTIDDLDQVEVPTLSGVSLTVFSAALAGFGVYHRIQQRRIA